MAIQTLNIATDDFNALYNAFNNNTLYFPTGLTFTAPNTLTLNLNGAPALAATLPFFEDKLLTGFAPSISGVGPYNLDTTPGTYQLNGQIYSLLANSVAIPAADPLLNRIDLLVVNNTPGFQYITGTASATPVEPAIPVGTLPIVFIFVSNTGAGIAPSPTPAPATDTPNFLRFGAQAIGINVKSNFGAGVNITFGNNSGASSLYNVALGTFNKIFHGSAYKSVVLADSVNQTTALPIKGAYNIQIAANSTIDYGVGTTIANTPNRNFMFSTGALQLIDNQTNNNALFFSNGVIRGANNFATGSTVTISPTFSATNCQFLGVSKAIAINETNTTFVNALELVAALAPTNTANKLYRIGAALYWNGGAVGGTAPIQPGTVLNSMPRWNGVNWVEVGTPATLDSVGVLRLQRNVIGTSVKDIVFGNNQFSLTQTRPTGAPTPFLIKLQGRVGTTADGTGLTFAQLFVGNGNPGTTFARLYQQYDEPTGLITNKLEVAKASTWLAEFHVLEDNPDAGNVRQLQVFKDIGTGFNSYGWRNGSQICLSFDDTDRLRGEIMAVRSTAIYTQVNTYANEPVFIGSQGGQVNAGVKNTVFAGFANPNPNPAILFLRSNYLVTSNLQNYGADSCGVRSVSANTTVGFADAFILMNAPANNITLPIAANLMPGRIVYIRNQTGSNITVQRNGQLINGLASNLTVTTGTGVMLLFSSVGVGWWQI